MTKRRVLKGRVVSPGSGEGEAIVAKSPVPISAVGIDLETGTFRWKDHELNEVSIKNKILVMPKGIGFTGGDWALYNLKKVYGSAPRAIVCSEIDIFTAAGSILGEIPVIDRVGPNLADLIQTGDIVSVNGGKGIVEILRAKEGNRGKLGRGKKKIVLPQIKNHHLHITEEEERMLEGEQGEGTKKCMEFLLRLGEAFDARRLVKIQSVHQAGCAYRSSGEGALSFLEWLVETGAKVKVPSTLNPITVDLKHWRNIMGLPRHFYTNQLKTNTAFQKLGYVPLFSCTPYWSYIAPRFGDHIVWGEHNAVCYANSVLGARTNFEAHLTAIPATITGRIPEYGMHLKFNRKPQVLVRVKTEIKKPIEWRCLGIYVGSQLRDKIPLFAGLPKQITNHQFRDLCSTIGPPYGNIPMLHVEGVTPEAVDINIKGIFGERSLLEIETLEVGKREIDEAFEMVTTGMDDKVDLVTLGCPYCSIEEIKEIANLIEGKKIHAEVEFWVWTDRGTRAIAASMGLSSIIEKAGGHILSDSCAIGCPLDHCSEKFKNIVTDSPKTAGFISQEAKMGTYIGSIDECIEAALSGRWLMK